MSSSPRLALPVVPVCTVLAILAAACGGGAAPAASPEPPSAPSAAATTSGSEGRTSIYDVVGANRDGLDRCWEQARATSKGLPSATSVDFTFDVDPAGVPHTVDLQYKHRFEEDAKECLRTAALALRFPEHLAGKQTVTVAFPRR